MNVSKCFLCLLKYQLPHTKSQIEEAFSNIENWDQAADEWRRQMLKHLGIKTGCVLPPRDWGKICS